MAATSGVTGLLASSGSGNTHDLITNSDPYTGTLSLAADSFDATAFAASLESLTYVQGLKSWSIDFGGRFQNKAGLEASVTFASGYVVGCRSYTLNVSAPEYETTAFGASLAWKTWTSGAYSWSGTFDVDIDSTTSLSDLTAPGGAGAAATFKFGEEDPDVDDTAAGNIITTQLQGVVAIGDLNRATYTFQGSGNLTFAGENSLITAGTLGVPAANTATTLTAASGKTFAGSTFWTSIGISAGVGSLVDITGTLRGTGALTIG
jgi:hypothetical protein